MPIWPQHALAAVRKMMLSITILAAAVPDLVGIKKTQPSAQSEHQRLMGKPVRSQ